MDGIRRRVDALVGRLAQAPQFPTQGKTIFVDLAAGEVRGEGYTPQGVVETFLEGRGANFFYLWNLMDEEVAQADRWSPEIPLIFGQGLLTGIVPSAARGNATSISPETGVLMDSNIGDYFPSFCKLQGVDRIVVFGRAPGWTLLVMDEGRVRFEDAAPYVGMDNLDMRQAVGEAFGGRWNRDLAMINVTVAGENRVLSAAIMGGPKACYARGGTGARMGNLHLKGVLLLGHQAGKLVTASGQPVKDYNRVIAKQLLETGVVKHALKTRGTPFLYKPSRLLGAMGTKNNQQTTWTDELDAENLDPWRPGMAGCFRCPVNCRPLNDLGADGEGDRYDEGDGPEYVTLGKFGPNIGVTQPKQVVRLNNICNDLGLDTASSGSALGWALELWQRGILDAEDTGGLELNWGDADLFERLLFMTARREGFGDSLAESARAVDTGRYPEEALDYRMAVKGLFQSDPHDARILKAFALGLAVATRGMDHLRNRATLEINARINDDPGFKKRIYRGHDVAAKPNVYETKEAAVRVCEDTYAVGDSVGMCRFTTHLFNSPSLPGMEQFSQQIENVTGLKLTPDELFQCGLNVTGLERMVNHRLGVRRADDTLPRRWFDEEVVWGPYAGERIDRDEFDAMLSRFYALSDLNSDGHPVANFRAALAQVAAGFCVRVRLPDTVAPHLPSDDRTILLTEPVTDLKGLIKALEKVMPGVAAHLEDGALSFAVNDELILHGQDGTAVADGDRVELMASFAGG